MIFGDPEAASRDDAIFLGKRHSVFGQKFTSRGDKRELVCSWSKLLPGNIASTSSPCTGSPRMLCLTYTDTYMHVFLVRSLNPYCFSERFCKERNQIIKPAEKSEKATPLNYRCLLKAAGALNLRVNICSFYLFCQISWLILLKIIT